MKIKDERGFIIDVSIEEAVQRLRKRNAEDIANELFNNNAILIIDENHYKELCLKISDLETKLAEKEKEALKWKNKKVKYLVDNLLGGENLAIQTVEEIREDFRQNSYCNDYHEYIVNMEIFEYFNNKIKSLKGEK